MGTEKKLDELTFQTVDEKYIIDRIAVKCKEQIDKDAATAWQTLQVRFENYLREQLPGLKPEQRHKVLAALSRKPNCAGKRPVPVELVYLEAERLAVRIAQMPNPLRDYVPAAEKVASVKC